MFKIGILVFLYFFLHFNFAYYTYKAPYKNAYTGAHPVTVARTCTSSLLLTGDCLAAIFIVIDYLVLLQTCS